MTEGVLSQAFVYLCAAVVFVPLAKWSGLGAVLGYLLAGVAVGPYVLKLVGGGQHVMHFAEFGVVMMLFLVGLELRPALLWQLRRPIFLLGGLQVVLTTAVISAAALALGQGLRPALAIGMIVSMSSTAIVLSSLSERALLKTQGGESSFAVLLFQDIAVIPILALFPLLAAAGAEVASSGDGKPAWRSAAELFGAVGGIVLAGRFVVRPVFQFLAFVKLRESFIAFALMLVVGIALLMQQVGLSPALGTFVAGVVLADSEYRHELEADVEPFKGLLLGLFFISIGAEIDFGLIGREPLLIAGIVLGSLAAKFAVLYGLGRLFKLSRPSRWLFAFALPQIGEFAFVLISFGLQSKIFGVDVAAPLVAAVAISMVLTPGLFIAVERWVLPRVTERDAPERDQEVPHSDQGHVVIAGHGRFGQVVGRVLRANRVATTVLDLDAEMVDILGRLGVKVYYGDASRLELLEAAGCARARLFVLAVDDKDEALKIAHTVKKHFPALPVIARARDRPHYFDLRKAGIDMVHRETFASAFEAGVASLRVLGYRAYTAQRLAQRWRDHEERELGELLKIWGSDRKTYFARARQAMEEAERLMRDEDPTVYVARDGAWDNESLRAEVAARSAGPAAPSPSPSTSSEGGSEG